MSRAGRAGPRRRDAGAGVPAVRAGVPAAARAHHRRAPRSPCPSCGRASARWPPPTRTPGSSRPTRRRRSAPPPPQNRMIGFPYTKLMNSNNAVEQGAAVILCSAERADRPRRAPRPLGVPAGGTDAHDHYFVSRARRTSAPRPPCGWPAGPPSTWPVSASTTSPTSTSTRASRRPWRSRPHELGLGLDRPLTVTGGLSFAGGPWNNYVTHSIATMARRAARGPRRASGWSRPTAASSPSTPSASTAPSRRPAVPPRGPPGRGRRPPPTRGLRGPRRRRRRRGVDRDARPRRQPGDRRSSPPCSPTAAGPGARTDDADISSQTMVTEELGGRRSTSAPTAPSTSTRTSQPRQRGGGPSGNAGT